LLQRLVDQPIMGRLNAFILLRFRGLIAARLVLWCAHGLDYIA